jgi:YHS domain-containing protein
MRRMVRVVGVVALVSLVGLFLAGCENKGHEGHEGSGTKPGMEHEGSSSKATPKAAKPAAAEVAQKTCPVMGGKIVKTIYTDHDGRRVYFCCGGCIGTFKKDPAKYLAKIDAEIQKAKDAAKPAG